MTSIVGALWTSPILRALAIFSAVFAVAFAIAPTFVVVEVLDSFSVAGGVTVTIRFGRDAWASLLKHDPRPEDVWLAGGVGVALSIAMIRSLRQIGIELGVLQSVWVAYAFGAITVLMVFGLFLKAVAPPIADSRARLTPYAGVGLAIVAGTGVAAAVAFMRWLF